MPGAIARRARTDAVYHKDDCVGLTAPDIQLWSDMLRHLRAHNASICRQWFEEIEPAGFDAGVLRLRARTSIHRDYLRNTCADQFNDAARTVSQRLVSIHFLGPDEESARNHAFPDHSPRTAAHPIPATPPRESPAPALHQQIHTVPAAPAADQLQPSAPASNNHGAAGVLHDTESARANHIELRAPTPSISPLPPAPPAPAFPPVGEIEHKPETVRWELTSRPDRSHDHRHGSLTINPDYAFENFVVGPNNRLAHAAALAVANNPGRAYNPYFVHGGVGLGKTHLLQAISLRVKENNPAARIFYTSCEGFMTQFMESVQAGEMVAFRQRFRDVDLLVIDDVHFLAKRDRTQEEFFHTFNSLYQDHKQIILSSDAPPEDIPDLEDRLVSRFKWGLVTSVAPPAYETRVAILKNKARMRGFVVPDDVACHIATRIDSNIRELEGAIVKLHMLHTVDKRPVDMAMAAVTLGEESAKLERHVQIQTIITAVTDFYNVKVTDLQSKRRHRSVALPRQVCMFFVRKHTRYSLEEIGGYFGGRDHTTVMHAVKSVEERCETDTEFGRVIKSLDLQLRQLAQDVTA